MTYQIFYQNLVNGKWFWKEEGLSIGSAGSA